MITNQEYIELFFSRSFEKDVDKLILDDINYIVPMDKLMNYVNNLIAIPYSEFLEYNKAHLDNTQIESRDITQSSSFCNCELELCNKMLFENNPGMKAVDIGKLFPDEVRAQNDIAFTKYGENQIKTAENLGLAYIYFDYWYISCLGYVYPRLNISQRISLLARTLLRDKLYSRIITDALAGNISLENYMSCLSISTIERRMSSVAKLVSICLHECDKEKLSNNIVLEYRKKKYNNDTNIYYVDLNSDIIIDDIIFYNILRESKEMIPPTVDNSYDDKFNHIGENNLSSWGIINTINSLSYQIYKQVKELISNFSKTSHFNIKHYIDKFDFINSSEKATIVSNVINKLTIYCNPASISDSLLFFGSDDNNILYIHYRDEYESTIEVDSKSLYDFAYSDLPVVFDMPMAAEDIPTDLYNHTVLIKKKDVDWDLFEHGIRIQEKFIPKLETAIGSTIKKGAYFNIELRFLSTKYVCILDCPITRGNSRIVNIVWADGKRSKIANALKKHYAKTYEYLNKMKSYPISMRNMDLPKELQCSVYLTYIENSHSLILDTSFEEGSENEQIGEEGNDPVSNELNVPEELQSMLNAQLDIFSKMRRSGKKGIKAPHKPVLMLSIILWFEKFNMNSSIVILNNNLKVIFDDVWNFYVENKELFNCNIYAPFNHIDSALGHVVPYFTPLQIELSASLLQLIKNKEACEVMKRFLIDMINCRA